MSEYTDPIVSSSSFFDFENPKILKISNLSTGNSSVVCRGPDVVGIPSKCWCGAAVVCKTSKSENNPGCRYYRCQFAYMNKLGANDHLFKWTDEAMLNEIDRLSISIDRIETHLIGLGSNGFEHQKKELERMVRKSECKMKKWIVVSLVLVLGALGTVAFMKK